jgi:tetratricopeptide (TPR) repeat protein
VESSTVVSATVAPAQTESVETTQIASIAQAETSTNQAESSTSTLEIISTSKVAQKDLWLREAYAAYKSGNDSLAMTRYNQVLEVDPGNRNALLARAAINVQNNNGNAAIKDYQTLLVHNPKDSLAMTSLITVANFSPLEAESQLKLMIRDEPDSPYLNFALANTYGVQNRWQEAQGYYFKALENNPGDPNYAYNLAVSLEHIAQPLAAVGYYQRALDNIDNGLATFNREIVSQRMETLAKQ